MINEIVSKLENKNIAILGFGKEGKSTFNFINKYVKNSKITILDKNESLSDFPGLSDIHLVLGDNYLDNLDSYDLIIKSPGIKINNLNDSIMKKITSQVNLLLDSSAYVIGITGTKGKSTTSSLIYKIIKDQGIDTYLVGNIGNPILDIIDKINKDTILVAEFSAHQLEFVKSSPNIGILLNLYEEHLDYFGNVDNYYNSKLNIFKYQNSNDYGIYGDSKDLNKIINSKKYNSKMTHISINNKDINYIKDNYIYINNKKVYNINDERNLIGTHNLNNIMFALKVADILNLDINKVVKSINSFEPLKHRLQKVGTYKNITFYNDTIATIPEATLNGINSIGNVDTLIFGGLDRGIDYTDFPNKLINTSVNNFICMKDTGYKIGKIIEQNSNKKVFYVENMEEAVKLAYEVTNEFTSCLLSPAAPSYNEYKNFEEKGDIYILNVNKYSNN